MMVKDHREFIFENVYKQLGFKKKIATIHRKKKVFFETN